MTGDARTCDAWNPADCEGTEHCPPRCPRFVDEDGRFWLVRPVRDDDRAALLEMYREFDPGQRAQGVPPLVDYRLEAWLDALLDEGCNFVARSGEIVAGHAAYTPTDAPEPELAVFVRGEFEGRGLGTELCRHVVATAAAGGRDALVLEVEPTNRRAISVYEKLGFRRIGRFEGGGRDPGPGRSIRMRLPLSSDVRIDVRHPPALRG